MGRKEKHKAKKTESSDEEEANEDLSLKIVEKALQMHAHNPKPVRNDVVRNGASFSQQNELVAAQYDDVLDGSRGIAASEMDSEEIKTERKRKKKKKNKKVESGDQSAVIAEEQETVETIKVESGDRSVFIAEEQETVEKDEPAEAGMVETSDNIVLRKLLRGPRYFDPPDSGWGTCYNCGEEGHAAVNCTAAKRKKPCFVCGSLEHSVRQCTMARDCFICKKGGHRAKDCPEKHDVASTSLTICLKCGNSGHEMFSCKDDYSLDDLKEIQCYVCKRFGHLCCVNTIDATPRQFSCYKCGQLGHTGLACSRLRTETTDAATPSSCYKCGEEGHFARECSSSVKVWKRRRELSDTKTPRFQKENDHMGYRSAPHDMGKARKKKKPLPEERGITNLRKSKHRGGWVTEHPGEFSPLKSKRNSPERGFTTPRKSKHRGGWVTEHPGEFSPLKSKRNSPERGITTPQKSKHRGGWMTEHPGEFPPFKSERNSWRSPVTPSTKRTKIHSFSSGSHMQSFKSSKVRKAYDGTPNSRGSANAFHHRFSASRFGNPGSDGSGRSYNWW